MKLPERKPGSGDYEPKPILYVLHITGGSTFTNLTEDQVRKELASIDPEEKLVKGKDYTVKPLQNN